MNETYEVFKNIYELTFKDGCNSKQRIRVIAKEYMDLHTLQPDTLIHVFAVNYKNGYAKIVSGNIVKQEDDKIYINVTIKTRCKVDKINSYAIYDPLIEVYDRKNVYTKYTDAVIAVNRFLNKIYEKDVNIIERVSN